MTKEFILKYWTNKLTALDIIINDKCTKEIDREKAIDRKTIISEIISQLIELE